MGLSDLKDKKRPRGGNFDASRSAPRKKPVAANLRIPDGLDPEERPGLAARVLAAKLLGAVIEAKTSADGLLDATGGHPHLRALEPRDQALVRAIVVTALRFRGTIERLVSDRIERPLPAKATSLRHVLHVAVAQIVFLDIPDSAAVDLAVASAAKDPRTRRFADLVNAVLRRIAREKASVPAPTGRENAAPWFYERLVEAYGAQTAEAIANAHLTPAALDLTAKGDPAALAAALGGRVLPTGTVRLTEINGAITGLPGFPEGEWWVQDAAASLPVQLFGDVRGLAIADVCAAPGGKTMQLASRGARVTAMDISASRMRRLLANLERTKLTAETFVGDLATFVPTDLFDGVLVDAPCSSTGTVRRHPDVQWTKDAAGVAMLASVQARLLRQAAALVRPGGTLVFSNCSLDPQEGEEVVAAFLAENAEFVRVPVQLDEIGGFAEGLSPNGDIRTTPAMLAHDEARAAGLDGFYASRLRRLDHGS